MFYCHETMGFEKTWYNFNTCPNQVFIDDKLCNIEQVINKPVEQLRLNIHRIFIGLSPLYTLQTGPNNK